jgi:hypothetical protein
MKEPVKFIGPNLTWEFEMKGKKQTPLEIPVVATRNRAGH